MSDRSCPCLHRFAVFVAFATLVLLVAGGLVTSTKSGDAVPDWWFLPITFHQVLPEGLAKFWIELGHRIVGATIGLLVLGLAIAVGRGDDRPWMRRLGWSAFALVVLQGCLGGFRVEQILWPRAVAVIHACLAQAIFCLLVAIAAYTSKGWNDAKPLAGARASARWGTAATAVVFLQLVLGAVFRHTRVGLWAHAGFAVVVAMACLGAVIVALGSFGSVRFLARPAKALLAALLLQLGLGVATWWALANGYTHSIDAQRLDLAIVTGHLAVGALLLASALRLALSARRLDAGFSEAPTRRHDLAGVRS